MRGQLVLATLALLAYNVQAQSSYCIFGSGYNTPVTVGDRDVFCLSNGKFNGNPSRCTDEHYVFRCRALRVSMTTGNSTVNKARTNMDDLCTSLANSNSNLFGHPVMRITESLVLGFRGDYDFFGGTWVAAETGTETVDDVDCYVLRNLTGVAL